MTGRLFLHIGPPKTATTALQYAFEELSNETLVYGGTFQPRRKRNAGSLSDILFQAANGSRAHQGRPLEETLTKIRDDVRSGKIMVISEEMLGLSRSRSMAHKLAFLGECFAGVPTTIILCLRNPLDAIPSLYQELYRAQPFLTKLSFARFCRSDAIDCYDYRKIITLLQEAGFETIRVIGFERVCSGDLTVQELFGHPGLSDKRLELRKVNSSRVKDSTTIRALDPISLEMIGQTRLFRKLRKKLRNLPPFRDDRVAGSLTTIARRISIPNSEYRKLRIPEAQVSHYMDSYRFACALEVAHPDQAARTASREPV